MTVTGFQAAQKERNANPAPWGEVDTACWLQADPGGWGEHREAPPLSVLPSTPPTPLQERSKALPSEDAWPLLITAWQVVHTGSRGQGRSCWTQLNSLPLLSRGGSACFSAPPPPLSPTKQERDSKWSPG